MDILSEVEGYKKTMEQNALQKQNSQYDYDERASSHRMNEDYYDISY